MNTYKIKSNLISELINGDFIKINDGGQTEIWHNNSVVAVLSKDVSVIRID